MWLTNFCGAIDIFGGTNLKQKQLAQFKNSLELQNQLMRWMNVALNMYVWEGLPKSVDARFLEISFITRGAAMIVEMEGSYYSLLCLPGYDYNLYGYPTRAFGMGMNGFTKQFDLFVDGADEGKLLLKTVGIEATTKYNAVLGFDNKARYPYMNYITNSCLRLADIRRSADVVRNNLKQPAIVACEDTQVNTVKEAFKQRDENQNVIAIGLGGLSMDSIKVWDLKTDPNLLKEFADAAEREENYLREVFGLDSIPNQDKRERLITDEAESNNEITQSNGDIRLNMREKFCEQVNEAFGLNISVRVNVEVSEDVVDEEAEEEEEEEEDVDE